MCLLFPGVGPEPYLSSNIKYVDSSLRMARTKQTNRKGQDQNAACRQAGVQAAIAGKEPRDFSGRGKSSKGSKVAKCGVATGARRRHHKGKCPIMRKESDKPVDKRRRYKPGIRSLMEICGTRRGWGSSVQAMLQ